MLHLSELRFASQLLLEPSVIPVTPTTKQNNTDKKLDFSTGRVWNTRHDVTGSDFHCLPPYYSLAVPHLKVPGFLLCIRFIFFFKLRSRRLGGFLLCLRFINRAAAGVRGSSFTRGLFFNRAAWGRRAVLVLHGFIFINSAAVGVRGSSFTRVFFYRAAVGVRGHVLPSVYLFFF